MIFTDKIDHNTNKAATTGDFHLWYPLSGLVHCRAPSPESARERTYSYLHLNRSESNLPLFSDLLHSFHVLQQCLYTTHYVFNGEAVLADDTVSRSGSAKCGDTNDVALVSYITFPTKW